MHNVARHPKNPVSISSSTASHCRTPSTEWGTQEEMSSQVREASPLTSPSSKNAAMDWIAKGANLQLRAEIMNHAGFAAPTDHFQIIRTVRQSRSSSGLDRPADLYLLANPVSGQADLLICQTSSSPNPVL